MEDYRKLFEDTYNIIVPNGFDVHHIDCDHDNNSIDNLMILPKELHEAYHAKRNLYQAWCNFSEDIGGTHIVSNEVSRTNEVRTALLDFLLVLRDCAEWADYMKYLKDEVYNIHNFTFYRKDDPHVRR